MDEDLSFKESGDRISHSVVANVPTCEIVQCKFELRSR